MKVDYGPAIVEWPAHIKPQVSTYPACTMDIFPTLIDFAGLSKKGLTKLQMAPHYPKLLTLIFRPAPHQLAFVIRDAAWIDNNYKLITLKVGSGEYQLTI